MQKNYPDKLTNHLNNISNDSKNYVHQQQSYHNNRSIYQKQQLSYCYSKLTKQLINKFQYYYQGYIIQSQINSNVNSSNIKQSQQEQKQKQILHYFNRSYCFHQSNLQIFINHAQYLQINLQPQSKERQKQNQNIKIGNQFQYKSQSQLFYNLNTNIIPKSIQKTYFKNGITTKIDQTKYCKIMKIPLSFKLKFILKEIFLNQIEFTQIIDIVEWKYEEEYSLKKKIKVKMENHHSSVSSSKTKKIFYIIHHIHQPNLTNQSLFIEKYTFSSKTIQHTSILTVKKQNNQRNIIILQELFKFYTQKEFTSDLIRNYEKERSFSYEAERKRIFLIKGSMEEQLSEYQKEQKSSNIGQQLDMMSSSLPSSASKMLRRDKSQQNKPKKKKKLSTADIIKQDPSYSDVHKRVLKLPPQHYQSLSTLKIEFKNTELTQNDLCRYLYINDYDLQQTQEVLKEYLQLRKTLIQQFSQEQYKKFKQSYVINYIGQDYQGRPVVLMIAQNFKPYQIDLQIFLKQVAYFMEYQIPKKRRGYVDTHISINDYSNLSRQNVSIDSLKKAMNAGMKFGPQRSYKIFGVNLNTLAYTCYRAVKHFIPQRTMAKTTIVGQDKQEIMNCLLPFMDQNVIPQHLGGKNKIFLKRGQYSSQ